MSMLSARQIASSNDVGVLACVVSSGMTSWENTGGVCGGVGLGEVLGVGVHMTSQCLVDCHCLGTHQWFGRMILALQFNQTHYGFLALLPNGQYICLLVSVAAMQSSRCWRP